MPPRTQIESIAQYINQGAGFFRQGNFTRSVEVLEAGSALAKECNLPLNHPMFVTIVVNLADSYMSSGRYEMTEHLISHYLNDVGHNLDVQTESHLLSILINLNIRTDRIKEAEPLLMRSIHRRIQTVGEFDPELIADYHLLSFVYLRTDRLVQARQLLLTMAAIRDRTDHSFPQFELLDKILDNTRMLLGTDSPTLVCAQDATATSRESIDENQFVLCEAESWRHFTKRDFDTSARLSGELLAKGGWSTRLLEIWLISKLSSSELSEPEAESAKRISEINPWANALARFTLSEIPLTDVRVLAKSNSMACQTLFYAALMALQKRRMEDARNLFSEAAGCESNIPERREAMEWLYTLDHLARDFTDLDASEKEALKATFQHLIYFDLQGLTSDVLLEWDQRGQTPEVFLLSIVITRALGTDDLLESIVALSRRLLIMHPWHTRLIDVIIEKVSSQALLSNAANDKEIYQLHFYTMLQKLFAGDWKDAELHREKASKIQVSCPESDLVFEWRDYKTLFENVLKHLSSLIRIGRLNTAERISDSALALASSLPSIDTNTVAGLLVRAGTSLGMQRKLPASLRMFRRYDELKVASPEMRFSFALNYGQVCLENGLLAEGQRHLQDAAELGQTIVNIDSVEKAVLCNALGRLLTESGDPSIGLNWYQEAISELNKSASGDDYIRAIVEDNMGVSLCLLARYQEAISHHEIALQMLKDKRHLADVDIDSLQKVSTNAASALLFMGRSADASKCANEALEINQKTQNRSNLRGDILSQISLIQIAREEFQEALESLQEAARFTDNEMGNVIALSSDEMRMAYGGKARLETSLLLTVANGIAGTPDGLERVFEIVLRRKAMVSEARMVRREALVADRYPALRRQLDELTSINGEIAAAQYVCLRAASVSERPRLSELRERARFLENNLSRELPELQNEAARVGVRDLFRNLPRSWSVIEIVRSPICSFAKPTSKICFSEDRYWAFLVPNGELDSLALIDLGVASALDRVIAAYRDQLGEFPVERIEAIIENRVI